ncbi:adhesion exoprotein [Secundilactobacillus silagincola]|uniref:Adhesion exoprotein n=1 Tax=Secundilactobacillus silagincola TaxID=1714681 RepID=A0A1Z5H4L6_9LACO|nr:adhesion exoprotein [Secundilactobacillus silagincola]
MTGGQFHITAAPVTIIAPTLTKSYDGQSYTGSDNEAKIVGLPANPQATKLNYSLTDLSQDTNVQANGYGIEIQLGENPNYDVKTVSGHLTINSKQLAANAIVISQASKVYDNNANTVPVFTLSAPDTATYPNFVMPTNLTATDFDTSKAASQKVGHYPVTLTADGVQKLQDVNPNYVVSANSISSGLLNITTKTITIIGPQLTKTYDGKAYAGQYQVSVDGLPVNGVKPSFDLTDISGDINAGTYTLTASGEDIGNYAVTYKAGSLIINKADLTATINDQTKVYDNNAANDPENYTVQLSTGDQLTLPSSDFNLAANNGGSFSQNVGNYTVSLNSDGINAVNQQMQNYILAASNVPTGHFNITPEQVATGAISIDSASKVYDGDANTDPKTYGLTVSNQYPEVVIPDNLTAADFDTTGIDSQNVGNYNVKLTQSGIDKLNQANTNYRIDADSISSGQLHITKRPVTITADDVQKVYDGSSYDEPGTAKVASNIQSGTPLIYTVNVPKNVNTVTSAPITITADTTVNSNYALTTVDGKLTISPKVLADNAITISHATKTYDDDANNVPTFTLSAPDATDDPNFVMPTNLTTADFNTTLAASQNVGDYDVSLTDSGIQKLKDVNPNYVISTKSVGNGSLNITRKTISISAPTLSKIYDGYAYSGNDLSGTVTDQIGNQQPVYRLTDLSQDVNADGYEIDVIVDPTAAVNQNYDIQTATGKLTINKAPVTITAPQGLTKVYDGSGYVLNDDSATVTGKPDNGATVNYHLSSLETAVNAGTYSVNVTDTTDNPNYDITVVPSTFSVTKNTEASVQIGSASKTYDNDENTNPKQYVVTLPAGVNAPSNWSADDFEVSGNSQNVGSYAVTLSDSGIQKLNAANTNYSFAIDNVKAGRLTITSAPITVTAPTMSKTYDGSTYAGEYQAAVAGTPVKATAPSFVLTDISQDINAGTYGIQATAKDNTANYAITYVGGTLTITPQALGQATGNSVDSPANTNAPADNSQSDKFVVVKGATKVYDGDASTDPITYQVFAPSDYADFNVPTFTADDFTTVNDGQNVGNHAVSLNAAGLAKLQAANKNYTFNAQSIQNGLLVITPAPISIAAPNLTKQYDGYPYAGALTPVITGVPAQGVAPVYTLPSLNDDVDAGNYPILVDISANDNPNYTISTTPGQLTINPMTPQFRFMIDATYQLYTGASADDQHVYKVTITGADLVQPQWTPEDFVVSGTPDAVGAYPVTLSSTGWKKLQQANPNDVINVDPAKVTPGELVIEPIDVEKADLGQIQVGSQTKVYDGETDDPTNYTVTLPDKLIAPVWTASDFERQDASETAGNYAVTLSDSGLTALQAANPNYVISAEDITPGQLTITKAPVTITAPSGISKTDDGQPYSGSATGKVTGQPANGTSVVYQLDYGNNGSVGTHLINVIASPKLNPNYDITAVSNSYQILPQPVVVTPSVPVETKQPQSVVVTPFVPAKMRQPQTVVEKSTLPVKQLIVNYLVDKNDPSTHQAAEIVPPAHELDEAKHIVESAPEQGELVVSNQTGSNSNRRTNKHNKRTVSPASEQTTQNDTQQVNYAGNSPYRMSAITAGKQSAQSLTQLSSSQSPKTGTDKAAVANQLPQTNETQSSWFAILGAMLMSLLGLLGFKKRRSDR